MNEPLTPFLSLRSINVNDHTEKKNGLTYLSWAWAVDQLLQQDSSATWYYSEPKQFGNSLMVFCTVKAFGKEMTAQLPVMDHRNKAIQNPDAFQVNTAMQRALAKAIALHGLGLYIYAGEDLPDGEEEKKPHKSVAKETLESYGQEEQDFLKGQAMEIVACLPDSEAAWIKYEEIKKSLDADEQVAMWAFLDSKTRAALKKGKDALETTAQA